MSAGFVHLHVHTQHSLLDGAIRVSDLLAKCKEYEMDSVAITDHGAMFGALEFYSKAKKAGIKPIVGCEVYIAPLDRHEKKVVDGTASEKGSASMTGSAVNVASSVRSWLRAGCPPRLAAVAMPRSTVSIPQIVPE